MQNRKLIAWTEKYRPSTLKQCVLPDRLYKQFSKIVENEEIPDLVLSGPAGTGKTSTLKAIAKDLDVPLLFINGSEERNIDTLRNIVEPFASSVSLNGKRKLVFYDEADYMNMNSTQPALRGFIEKYTKNCAFVFSVNYKNRMMPEILSRCSLVDFNYLNDDRKELSVAITKRYLAILKSEGIEVSDNKIVLKHVFRNFPDFRKTLKQLQLYAQTNGRIDTGILSQKDIQLDIVLGFLQSGDFRAMYDWSMTIDNDRSIFHRLFDDLYNKNLLKGDNIPGAIEIFADYDFRSASMSSFPMCLVTCLMEIRGLVSYE